MSSPPRRARTVAVVPALVLVVLVVVVVAVAVVVVVRVVRDDRPRVDAGTVLPAPDRERVVGLTSDLLLPFGTYRVTVGPALEELPTPCCLDEPADQRAPEGGSLVGVAVTLVPRESRPFPVAEPGTTLPTPTFTLVVETAGLEPTRTEYPVTSIGRDWDPTRLLNQPLQAYVAVEGTPDLDEMSLEVTYDGVTQIVHPDRDYVDSGDATQLAYSDRAPRQAPCGALDLPAGFVVASGSRPTCTSGRELVAYVGGLGWAPPGDRWFVVTTYPDTYVGLDRGVGARTYRYRSDYYADDGATVAARLAGQAPVRTWRTVDGNAVSVFAQPTDVTARTLTISTTYGDLGADDDPRAVDEVTLTWRSSF